MSAISPGYDRRRTTGRNCHAGRVSTPAERQTMELSASQPQRCRPHRQRWSVTFCHLFLIVYIHKTGWLGSRVVSVLDSGEEGPGFKSQLRRCRVTVLGKLFTPIVPLFTKQRNWAAALLRIARVTAGLAESNGSLPPGL